MKILRLLLTNLLVLVALLAVVNLVSAAILDGNRYIYNPLFDQPELSAPEPVGDLRAMLPVYKDKNKAREILDELFAMGFDYTPFVGWSRKPFSGQHTTVLKTGDRIVPQFAREPQATIRFFGGSAMWGTGVDDSHTVPGLIAAEFQDYRVFNHAEAGFNSRQSLARLVNLVNQGEVFDLVVFYDGVNDVAFQCTGEANVNGHAREKLIRARLERKPQSDSMVGHLQRIHFFRVLLASTYELVSNFYITVFAPSSDVGAADDTMTPEQRSLCESNQAYAAQVADTLIANWRIAKTIVEERGGRFLAVLQPVAYIGDAKVDYLSKSALRLYLKGDFAAVYSLIIQKIKTDEIPWVIDLTDVFDGDSRVYIDPFHVIPEGNRLVAERLKPIFRILLMKESG